jgi:hypothetical protein
MEEPACTMLLTTATPIAFKQFFPLLNLVQLLLLGWFLSPNLFGALSGLIWFANFWCAIYGDLIAGDLRGLWILEMVGEQHRCT